MARKKRKQSDLHDAYEDAYYEEVSEYDAEEESCVYEIEEEEEWGEDWSEENEEDDAEGDSKTSRYRKGRKLPGGYTKASAKTPPARSVGIRENTGRRKKKQMPALVKAVGRKPDPSSRSHREKQRCERETRSYKERYHERDRDRPQHGPHFTYPSAVPMRDERGRERFRKPGQSGSASPNGLRRDGYRTGLRPSV